MVVSLRARSFDTAKPVFPIIKEAISATRGMERYAKPLVYPSIAAYMIVTSPSSVPI